MYMFIENPGYVNEQVMEFSKEEKETVNRLLKSYSEQEKWDGFDWGDRLIVELWEVNSFPSGEPLERFELQN